VEDNNKMDIREVASSAGMHCTELANLEQFWTFGLIKLYFLEG
jgi:hypothetical protein